LQVLVQSIECSVAIDFFGSTLYNAVLCAYDEPGRSSANNQLGLVLPDICRLTRLSRPEFSVSVEVRSVMELD